MIKVEHVSKTYKAKQEGKFLGSLVFQVLVKVHSSVCLMG